VGRSHDAQRRSVACAAEGDGEACETMNRQCVNAGGIVSSSAAMIAGDAKCATAMKWSGDGS
jgi:hypothetical protein